jgi:hypothetical protein
MLVGLQQITQRFIPETIAVHNHHCDELKSNKALKYLNFAPIRIRVL